MMSLESPKVALIHDELVRRGGAEAVFEEMIRMFPQANVYSLYASNKPTIAVDGKRYPIRTSFLQKLPIWFRRHPARVLPFLLYAAERFDFSAYDLVISSASAFAKGIITRSSIPHICYCHTPTRYLWDEAQAVLSRYGKLTRAGGRVVMHGLRVADFAAAQRPDVFIANSDYTRQRIARTYRRDSSVIYPPVDTVFFTPAANRPRKSFVTVGRLTPLKYIEHAIVACEKLQIPLKVIGKGMDEKRLKRLAGKHTTFVGHTSPEQLREHMRGALALLQPGVEDFGMTAVEALACGTPVIGYGQGGIREIIPSARFGILYESQRLEALAEAIRQFVSRPRQFSTEELQQRALLFSRYRFLKEFEAKVAETLLTWGKRP